MLCVKFSVLSNPIDGHELGAVLLENVSGKYLEHSGEEWCFCDTPETLRSTLLWKCSDSLEWIIGL